MWYVVYSHIVRSILIVTINIANIKIIIFVNIVLNSNSIKDLQMMHHMIYAETYAIINQQTDIVYNAL